MVVCNYKGKQMEDNVLKELLSKQGQVIATLALRITTLEQILLEKNIVTSDEIAEKAINLSKEFTLQTQEAFRKITEELKKK